MGTSYDYPASFIFLNYSKQCTVESVILDEVRRFENPSPPSPKNKYTKPSETLLVIHMLFFISGGDAFVLSVLKILTQT